MTLAKLPTRFPLSSLVTLLVLVLVLWGGLAAASPRIQVIGDSVMTWNGDNAIPEVMARVLDEDVDNNARAGARLTRSNLLVRSVENQFRPGTWDWVVVNGGANDLNRDCRCASCAREIDALISQDGTRGLWPTLISQLTVGGAQNVMILGYYGPTGRGGRTDRCADELAIVDTRLDRLARTQSGVHFVDADPVMGPHTPEFFSSDLIHPNARGSRAIGTLVAEEIIRLDPAR